MNDLTEFLTARYDEAEKRERGKWRLRADVGFTDFSQGPDGYRIEPGGCFLAPEEFHERYAEPAPDAFVLADLESKRRIMARAMVGSTCGQTHPQMDRYCLTGHPDVETLRLLALPYVDHPDFDEKWRP